MRLVWHCRGVAVRGAAGCLLHLPSLTPTFAGCASQLVLDHGISCRTSAAGGNFLTEDRKDGIKVCTL